MGVEVQSGFIPSLCDKNDAQSMAPPAQAAAVQGGGYHTITAADDGQPMYLCRWEQSRAGARRVVVEKKLTVDTVAEAFAIARCIARTRLKGRKPWVTTL